MKRILILIIGLVGFISSHAQLMQTKEVFTHADTLRGSDNENRDWWDVMRYNIIVKPDYATKTIEGTTSILFFSKLRVYQKKREKGELPPEAIMVSTDKFMQIDLQQPLIVDSIKKKRYNIMALSQSDRQRISNNEEDSESEKVDFRRDSNIIYIQMSGESITQYDNDTNLYKIVIYYHGKPREAVNPPWDGGWVWTKDSLGNPWMSVAAQGLGASSWFPCKDIQSDEPDEGIRFEINCPDSLVAIGNGNGRIIGGINKEETSKSNPMVFFWKVKNPINTYDIIPYIGKYTNFDDTYQGEGGKLDLSYWVMPYNLEKAKKQFAQVKPMLQCFEYWFGKYPFYEDSYKLVEAPYLGMENQSNIAYGNKYINGYHGSDLSASGWGLKWDFIIIHESAHEWWGNSITSKDIADMWIHESFANYAETLYTEWLFGKEAGNEYCIGTRKRILNYKPIIGPYGVNKEGSGDMYYKGGNMIHNIRHIINNDSLFRNILRGLNTTFYHQTVTTEQIEAYINKHSGIDFQKIFDQYLRTTQIPTLTFVLDKSKQQVTLHWTNCVEGFNMPVTIPITSKHLTVTTQEQSFPLTKEELDWFTTKNLLNTYYIRL